jgi:long-chain fatty acid transport protein
MSIKKSFVKAARPAAFAALAVAVVAALGTPQTAHASAFQLKENSAKALGRSFAGSATAGGDASVVVNNPAAMTMLTGTVFQADVTAINFSTKFSGTGTDAFGRPLGGGNGGDGGTTIPVPAFFLSTQVNDRTHIGIAFSAPFGFKTNYNPGWVGRYHALKSDFQSLDATLSASYDLTDNFSIGASVIAQHTKAELTSAINYNGVAAGLIQQAVVGGVLPAAAAPTYLSTVNAVVPPGSDGEARIKGDDWGYGWQLGAFLKLTDSDRLALDYHSKISHTLEGKARFTMPSNVSALLSSPTVAPLLAGAGGTPFTNTTGTAPFTTPAFVNLSYWHQAQKYGIGADVTWTKWSVFKELRVNYANPAQPASVETFDWENTLFVSVGGEYYVNDKLTLRGGVAVDGTPTSQAHRDPRVPDGTRRWISVGLGYKATQKLDLNVGYAHIFVSDAHVNNLSPTGDRLVGNFSDKGNLLAFSAAYHF